MPNKQNKLTKNFSKSISLFVSILSVLPLLTTADSFTWGHINKYASPIYDEEIKLTDNTKSITITYPQEGLTNDYTIIAMHAYAVETPSTMTTEAKHVAHINNSADVEVLRGGIGFNYTTIRFQTPTLAYHQSTADRISVADDREGGRGSEAGRGNNLRAHYQLVIYGVDL
ncbi:uncharacterized protein LOC105664939 [Ceratitis capitata]|uniref:uncharacterized protein LOC105664939 n=1 Tax=Ceratitis capitata TaxID=7213 RepID=UPI0006188B4E|nr:uncharacterized protein LOC105664939 [Ceratitis capitata]